MPPIKIERIVSFTSEDPHHLANNLLSTDSSKKWKCKDPGEKTATVVLQLEQPYIIGGIDIGNEHSAYIEVLVARSTSPEDYKVLLVMSSFMTPIDAGQSQNINKVRMFKQEDFTEPEKNEKWDRIKIVCTQPFNRHVQYGLSFITLHSNGGSKADKPQQAVIGNFVVRPASPDPISAGSLFARRKETMKETLSGAAAIREATAQAQNASPSPVRQKLKHNLPATPNTQQKLTPDKVNLGKARNRNELLYSQDEEDTHEKIDKIVEKKAEEKKEKQENESKRKEKEKKASLKDSDNRERQKEVSSKNSDKKEKQKESSSKDSDKKRSDYDKKKKDDSFRKAESSKRKHSLDLKQHTPKKPKKKTTTKPFAKLLEGVVLVISGIQNPERASLRSMALSMGAKYKTDWDNTCTHLVCAFANTPKFNQVKGKGKIVKKHWVDDCYNERKRLPWRRYALDKADKGEESEEEICEEDDNVEESEGVIVEKYESDVEMKEDGSDTEERIRQIEKKKRREEKKDNEMVLQKESRKKQDTFRNYTKHKDVEMEDGSDTEERIRQIEKKKRKEEKKDNEMELEKEDRKTQDTLRNDTKHRDVEVEDGSDTEERIRQKKDEENKNKQDTFFDETEQQTTNESQSNKASSKFKHTLKDFFRDKIFHLDGELDSDTVKKIKQYVVAYKGTILDDIDSTIDIIVTNDLNYKHFREICSGAVCVSEDWVWKCHNSQEVVSMKGFNFE